MFANARKWITGKVAGKIKKRWSLSISSVVAFGGVVL
jgi:hypothetical protein